MHMQSMPVKNLSFSDSINLSKFSDPFSSMPSKTIFMLTWMGQRPPASENIRADGELDAQLLVRLHDVDPAHDRPLVVGRTTSVQLSGTLGVGSKLKGRVQPAVFLERGLDIVVAVDKECFLGSNQPVVFIRQEMALTFLGSFPISPITTGGSSMSLPASLCEPMARFSALTPTEVSCSTMKSAMR